VAGRGSSPARFVRSFALKEKAMNATLARIINRPLVKGALLGLAGGAALDGVSTAIYENEDLRTRIAEDAARKGRHVYEVGVSQLAGAFGKRLSRRQEKKLGWRFHQAFGLLGGIGYAALRRRKPGVGVGMGLAFGAVFFLLGDELLMPLAGWSPGPRKFSWKVHARGAVAHLAYGVAAEAAARLIDRAARPTLRGAELAYQPRAG
jgi:hypothetical protein